MNGTLIVTIKSHQYDPGCNDNEGLLKAPGFELHHLMAQRHIQNTCWGVGLTSLCRDAVGVFYSHRRLGRKPILKRECKIHIFITIVQHCGKTT